MSLRRGKKKITVYRHNQQQAERNFSIPTSRSISLDPVQRRLQEMRGAPLVQFLDESQDQASWKLLVDDLYADQDVWENIEEQPQPTETMGKQACNVNSMGFLGRAYSVQADR